MLRVTLHKIGEVHYRLHGTNGFHVKAKNERFTTAGSRCRQNLKNENFMSFIFGRLRQKIAPESVSHVQHDFCSFNQSNNSFVALSLPSRSSFLKLHTFWIVVTISHALAV